MNQVSQLLIITRMRRAGQLNPRCIAVKESDLTEFGSESGWTKDLVGKEMFSSDRNRLLAYGNCRMEFDFERGLTNNDQ